MKHYQYIHEFGEDVVIKGMEVDDTTDLIKSKSDDEDEKEKVYVKTCHEKKSLPSTDPNLKKKRKKEWNHFLHKTLQLPYFQG